MVGGHPALAPHGSSWLGSPNLRHLGARPQGTAGGDPPLPISHPSSQAPRALWGCSWPPHSPQNVLTFFPLLASQSMALLPSSPSNAFVVFLCRKLHQDGSDVSSCPAGGAGLGWAELGRDWEGTGTGTGLRLGLRWNWDETGTGTGTGTGAGTGTGLGLGWDQDWGWGCLGTGQQSSPSPSLPHGPTSAPSPWPHWGAPCPSLPLPCLQAALPWGKGSGWSHAAAPKTPQPHSCPWGSGLPCGSGGWMGTRGSSRAEFGLGELGLGPCPAVSSPAHRILPAHPFPAGGLGPPQPSCPVPDVPSTPGWSPPAPQYGWAEPPSTNTATQSPEPPVEIGESWRGTSKEKLRQAGLIEMNLISHVAAKLKIYKKFVVYKKVSGRPRSPARLPPPSTPRRPARAEGPGEEGGTRSIYST